MTDFELVKKMANGDAAARKVLKPRLEDYIWSSCLTLLENNDRLARAAVRDMWPELMAGSLSHWGQWDGNSSLESYVLLTVRDALLERIALLFHRDINAAWEAFSAFFNTQIRRMIARRHASIADREDAYQAVCLDLLKDGCRPLKAFSGRGSFAGHVRITVKNLILDDLRRKIGKRHMPAKIGELPGLEQEIFEAVFWDGTSDTTAALAVVLARAHPGLIPQEIEAARDRVRAALPNGYTGKRPIEVSRDERTQGSGDAERDLENAINSSAEVKLYPDPLEALISVYDQKLLEAAGKALKAAMSALEDEDRQYLELFLQGVIKPQDIAEAMRLPVTKVYIIKARVHRRLIALLTEDPDVQAWQHDYHANGRL